MVTLQPADVEMRLAGTREKHRRCSKQGLGGLWNVRTADSDWEEALETIHVMSFPSHHPASSLSFRLLPLPSSLLPSLRNDETEVQRRTFSNILQRVCGRTRNQDLSLLLENSADVWDHSPHLLNFSQCLLYFLPTVDGGGKADEELEHKGFSVLHQSSKNAWVAPEGP